MDKTKTFRVKGMHCSSCAQIISKEANKYPQIKKIDVNPLSEEAVISMTEDASIDDFNQHLKKLGYELDTSDKESGHQLSDLKSKKLAELKKQGQQLKIALPLASLLLINMLIMVAADYFSFTAPKLLPAKLTMFFSFVAASLIIFWIGRDFLKAVGRFIRYGKSNMDTLIGLGTGTAYFYSSLIWIFPSLRESLNLASAYFFDVSVIVITFVFLGKYLENRAKLRTNEVIEKLLNLQVKTAWVEKDGQELEIALDRLNKGDVVIVKPGMKIPADGEIIFGASAIDEAMISGEAMPVDKKIGDRVIGTTVNKQGMLKIRIDKIGAESVLAGIIAAIERAQNSKAPIQKLADRISQIFVPTVLVIALVSLLAWLIIGPRFMPWPEALSLAITCFVSVLVIACPCALGLATPTGIMVGLGLASKNGFLIKNAESLEKLSGVKVVVMDKTGTISSGRPAITDIVSFTKKDTEILQLAASLEKNSDHPLAQAVIIKAKEKNLNLLPVDNFLNIPGRGLKGDIEGTSYQLGSVGWQEEIDQASQAQIELLDAQGKTPLVLRGPAGIIGLLAVADTIKPEAAETVASLHELGLKVIMLSGDRRESAEHIARQAGIDEVIAEVMPEEKEEKIQEIRKQGYLTAMVGDGINDSIALSGADVGIAMADGSDIAIEAADITILGGDLKKVVKAVKLSRLTMKKIKQNLFWAFFYNTLSIPIAAGLLYPFFGWLLSPIIAALAMSLSSVSIIANSLLMKKARL